MREVSSFQGVALPQLVKYNVPGDLGVGGTVTEWCAVGGLICLHQIIRERIFSDMAIVYVEW